METKRNPAALAGLTGLAVISAPVAAQASPLTDVASFVFDSPINSLLVGLVGGAAVSGVVSGLVCRSVVSGMQDEIDELRQRNEAPTLTPLMKPAKHFKVDAAAPLPASGTVRAQTPAPSLREEAQASKDGGAGVSGRLGLGAHVATGAERVAKRFRSRREADMMDGLPVIMRADGSVADVGTDWWNTSVGLGSVTKVEDYVASDDSGSLAIPSEFVARTGKQRLVEAAKNASAEFAKDEIRDRLAFVDEGVFPEVHGSEGMAEDDWASALRSMDDRINARIANPEPLIPMPFCDVVGDMDTLDEPDGLEQRTTFIPFKPLAGHPEVVDTESYVNHLIEEEFDHNSSMATRNAAGRFLRLLEGGTSTKELSRPRKKASSTGSARPHTSAEMASYRPKHFAVPVAKEA